MTGRGEDQRTVAKVSGAALKPEFGWQFSTAAAPGDLPRIQGDLSGTALFPLFLDSRHTEWPDDEYDDGCSSFLAYMPRFIPNRKCIGAIDAEA